VKSPGPSVGIAGLGYMGLATGVGFAARGCPTVGFDIRAEARRDLRRGRTSIREPGLDPLFARATRTGRFRPVDSWDDLVRASRVIFLCLPTPRRPSGSIDLRPLLSGVRDLGLALRGVPGRRLVVVKSTVVPGTTANRVRPLLEQVSRRSRTDLGVASNPEFLAEGSMIRDVLTPERIVIGVDDRRDAALLRRVYRGFPAPILELTPSGAELVKYASNAFLATKVAFVNEISRLSERIGVEIDPVAEAVGLDSRIGAKFLVAGPGFGGSCFEKDVRALASRARELGVRLPLVESLVPTNDAQTHHAFEIIRDALGGLRRRRIALLGLSFKSGTDDVRETRALPIALEALRGGAEVRVHDPVATRKFLALWKELVGSRLGPPIACNRVTEALRGADAAVVHSPWPEYLRFPSSWTGIMRKPLVIDLRRALPPAVRRRSDLRWVGLGSGSSVGGASEDR